MGEPATALREFDTALKQTPNRYRAFLGLSRAADATGDRAKAAAYYGKLIELTKSADTERQEVTEAKAYLAGR
jgi:Tfp pilus assembly protein PilF